MVCCQLPPSKQLTKQIPKQTKMPYRIDESIVSNFITNHTRALRLSALPPDPLSRQCPICRDLYHAQDPAYLHPLLPADTPEYPVQVRDRGLCRHILGRRCIERHIRAGHPWSHTCPLCREEWFPAPTSARAEIVGMLDNVLGVLERLEMRDEVARHELENVEQALDSIRELLYSHRWM